MVDGGAECVWPDEFVEFVDSPIVTPEDDDVDPYGWIIALASAPVDPPLIATQPELEAAVQIDLAGSDSADEATAPEVPVEGLDDDGYLLPNWAMDETGICECLNSLGLSGPRLALQKGDETTLLQQILQHLGVEVCPLQFEWHRKRLVWAVHLAEVGQPLAKRLRGDFLPHALEGLRIQEQCYAKQLESQKAVPVVPTPFMVPRKGERRRRQLAVTSQLSKQEIELVESQKYVLQVIQLFELSSAPIVSIAAVTANPAQIFRGALGDTRTGTLRQYVRALTAFQSWHFTSTGATWPESVSQILVYIHIRTEEPCAPSIPQVFIKALSWFEKAGAFEPERRFGNNTLVQKTVDYSCEMLSVGIAPPKKAPRPPAALIASLEIYVCDTGKAEGLRAKAFQLLIKTYCSLREDDAQNLAPSQFRFFSGILVNTLRRTKTSGPTKRVKELPVCLAAGLSITDLPWLEKGLELVKSMGDEQRDHFLTNFTKDFTSSKPGRLSYANSAALGQRVLSEVKLRIFHEGSWLQSDINLIPAVFSAAFTEHGARAFMPTVLAELEIEKSRRDYVGRWSPTGSDDYTRSYRAVVKRLQQEAIKAVKGLDQRLGEGDIVERLTLFGEQLEIPDLKGHIQKFVENMEAFKVCLKEAADYAFEDVEVGETIELPKPDELKAIDDAVKLSAKRHLARIPQVRSGKFLIIYSQGRRFARLHKSDSTCPWAYTIVRDCEELDSPKPNQYNARCKICFPNLEASSDTSNSEEELD
jgi:hypothetical protein